MTPTEFHTETWRSVAARLAELRRQYVDALIASNNDGDQLRGKIALIDEVLGWPDSQPVQQIATARY